MNQSIRTLSSLVALAALSSLVACGGGGGASSPAPAPTPAPTANAVTVSTPASTISSVGQTVALTWSNTNNEACVGTGLLAGISASSGTVQATLSAEGQASYSVSCGAATSPTATLTVLPQYTTLTDPVFEQALVQAGIDDQVDGHVLTASVLAVTKLAILSGSGYTQAPDVKVANLGNAKITDLTGLANFRNLVNLRIEGQSFTTIDLSTLTQLQQLSLWQDPITTIDLSHNTQLKQLGISETGLTSVDVSMLGELTDLATQNAAALPYTLTNGVTVQGLTTLDVSHNAKLAHLYASYNRLTTLDLVANKALSQVEVDHNALTSLRIGANVSTLVTLDNPALLTLSAAVLTNAMCAASTSCQIDTTTVITAL